MIFLNYINFCLCLFFYVAQKITSVKKLKKKRKLNWINLRGKFTFVESKSIDEHKCFRHCFKLACRILFVSFFFSGSTIYIHSLHLSSQFLLSKILSYRSDQYHFLRKEQQGVVSFVCNLKKTSHRTPFMWQ